jgi:Trk K+ transport system NAD-binding subunit
MTAETNNKDVIEQEEIPKGCSIQVGHTGILLSSSGNTIIELADLLLQLLSKKEIKEVLQLLKVNEMAKSGGGYCG